MPKGFLLPFVAVARAVGDGVADDSAARVSASRGSRVELASLVGDARAASVSAARVSAGRDSRVAIGAVVAAITGAGVAVGAGGAHAASKQSAVAAKANRNNVFINSFLRVMILPHREG